VEEIPQRASHLHRRVPRSRHPHRIAAGSSGREDHVTLGHPLVLLNLLAKDLDAKAKAREEAEKRKK
jgi:hypothetical protein